MKVQKRDGRVAEYDKAKIITAIRKANAEVPDNEKVETRSIETIVRYVEKFAGKNILHVETIQDMIEKELMRQNKYILAKKYIIFTLRRYICVCDNIIYLLACGAQRSRIIVKIIDFTKELCYT